MQFCDFLDMVFFCVFKRHHQHQLSEILIALSKVYSLWSSPEEC
jgi:hypothetical protein